MVIFWMTKENTRWKEYSESFFECGGVISDTEIPETANVACIIEINNGNDISVDVILRPMKS